MNLEVVYRMRTSPLQHEQNVGFDEPSPTLPYPTYWPRRPVLVRAGYELVLSSIKLYRSSILPSSGPAMYSKTRETWPTTLVQHSVAQIPVEVGGIDLGFGPVERLSSNSSDWSRLRERWPFFERKDTEDQSSILPVLFLAVNGKVSVVMIPWRFT